MDSEKLKILLVEDDSINYKRVKQFLEGLGLEVLQLPGVRYINNYDDAVKMCQVTIPHIAILDISIKGEKDGIEIGSYIRENFKSPVILLTAHNNDENERRSGLINADGFVVKRGKPFTLEQLKADISRVRPRAIEAAEARKKGAWLNLNKVNSDLGFRHTRIEWENVHSITTHYAPRNGVIIKMRNGDSYKCRKSLTELNEDTPSYIIKINKYLLLNATLFTSAGKSVWKNYIDENEFEVAEPFRNTKTEAVLRALTARRNTV